MTTAALALTNDGFIKHPVPSGALEDDGSLLLKRGAKISIALHVLLALVALVIQHWPRSGLVGTPQEEIMNVMIVPLSALDTQLPKGSVEQIPQESPKTPAKSEPQPEQKAKAERPKKIIESKALAPRTAPPSEQISSSTAPSSSSNASTSNAPVGVTNGQDISVEQARISYQDMVATLLARAKRYPERALKRRMTGEATIRIEISADGSLSGFEILRSTETPILDDELRAMVQRASPFPAFPNDLHKRSLALIVPVAFRLDS